MIYPTLCQIIEKCVNFKVRINAAAALAVPTHREYFGGHFFSIWKSLIVALKESDNIIDFNEFQHQDNLVDQLCITMSHLVCLSGANDIVSLNTDVDKDAILPKWIRVGNRLVPERACILLKASCRLEELQKSLSGRKDALQNLIETFSCTTKELL